MTNLYIKIEDDRMPAKQVNVNTDNFQALVLDSDTPVLVYFWATWCGPCQAMSPVMDALAAAYDSQIEVVKCNVDSNPQISTRYGIQSIPTLIVFRKGEPVRRIIGLVPTGQIKTVLDRVLASAEMNPSLTTV